MLSSASTELARTVVAAPYSQHDCLPLAKSTEAQDPALGKVVLSPAFAELVPTTFVASANQGYTGDQGIPDTDVD